MEDDYFQLKIVVGNFIEFLFHHGGFEFGALMTLGKMLCNILLMVLN